MGIKLAQLMWLAELSGKAYLALAREDDVSVNSCRTQKMQVVVCRS
jgi:hypothetical protein